MRIAIKTAYLSFHVNVVDAASKHINEQSEDVPVNKLENIGGNLNQ